MELHIELVTLVTLTLTALTAVVGVTRYVTQVQFKVRQEHLEAEKEALERQHADLEARHKELVDEVAIAARIGTAALTRKQEIDDELSSVMEYMQANAGSLYIPLAAESSSEPLGLVFLSVQPFGREAAELKRKIIPIKSLAGRCFTIGQPFVRPDSKSDPSHFGQADAVSGYHTQDTLNCPLRHQGKTVGVLQLLNKKGSDRFRPADLERVEPYSVSLAGKVADFSSIPDHLEILGVTPEREAEYAAVMFCDLTHSSILFQEMNASAAIQHINEYVERLCDIAFSYKATVDSYMGDGVMFRFNVPRPVHDPPLKAVQAALEMQVAFDELKDDWITMGKLVGSVYNRTGIAYGPVHRAVVGHPQYQYATVFGPSVNVAANLCEAAKRDGNVIVVDDHTYRALAGKVQAKPVVRERLGKAAVFIESAYEVLGLSGNERRATL
jgi:class 3 adenylate cyclase/NTP pyrophosphatase (non-canonical NTP hydrolase)